MRCSPGVHGWQEADRVEKPSASRYSYISGGGEGGIAPEIQPYLAILVANDNRLQHAFPVIGTVNVAGAQGTPLKVTETG